MPQPLPPHLRAALAEALTEALTEHPDVLRAAVRDVLEAIALEDAVTEIRAHAEDPAHRAQGGLFAAPQAQA